ncbi:uncharacterized protein J8A68_004731 [[Candida] subhashii]|uniref:CMP/dCMP-type deaminase domain-containing protein n=1 Tax=[Candida] subhashii TaxID=561895 RepID=A0A8J5QGT9_9ASCO|nr:uncharacterized protein J8A68_004731 [[Candida] subhashii]KAG7661783.1 hypothetical protein J8A68_004731 [[Candida] subhashii]
MKIHKDHKDFSDEEFENLKQAVIKEGHTSFKAIAISSDQLDTIISPCGICRQFIREFTQDIPIYMFGNDNDDKFIKVYLSDLLPLSFGPENLLHS